MDVKLLISQEGIPVIEWQGMPENPVSSVLMGGGSYFLTFRFEGKGGDIEMDCPLDEEVRRYMSHLTFCVIAYCAGRDCVAAQLVPLESK